MPSHAWVCTRKGLFELTHTGHGWRIACTHFLGEPVSMMLPGDASQPMIAALKLGHFGVKCHASEDGGAHWHEVAAPTYPPQPVPADDQAVVHDHESVAARSPVPRGAEALVRGVHDDEDLALGTAA